MEATASKKLSNLFPFVILDLGGNLKKLSSTNACNSIYLSNFVVGEQWKEIY